MKKKFTKREIIDVLFSKYDAENDKDDIEVPLKFILSQLEIQINSVEEKTLEKLRIFLRKLRSDRNSKWQTVRRISCKFETKYGDWLNSEFLIPDLKSNLDTPVVMSNAKKGAGRPPLQFHEMSDRSKMREIGRISNENKNDSVRLISACRYAAKKSKEKDLEVVLKELEEGPDKAKKIRKLMEVQSIVKLSAVQALSFLLSRSFSKEDYVRTRLLVKQQGADIFPPYEKVLAEKQLCRPPEKHVLITEIEAKVLLQPLLVHTTERTFELQKDVLLQYLSKVDKSCTELETVFIFSYGFDGSSGHSRFNQGYLDTSQTVNDDGSLFATTLVPLRWLTSNNVVLWNNRSSQSASFARPVSLMYMKESAELILKVKNDLENQINELEAHEIILSGVKIQVHFSLYLTLIDGKVLNIRTDTKSMQTCPICHATPKMFNNLSNKGTSAFIPNPLSLQYGISPLHAWIRILELLLHISYRLEFKTWQVRSKQHKIKFAERKAKLQKMFWEDLSLHVDKPKPGGSGTTNNGNTARRAFEDPVKLAELLGLEKQLVINFKIILIALSVQLPIDANLFDELCFQLKK